MLKSLTIHKYQDIEPTTLRFHERRNVLLGKNGSGKTTLLRLISMILRSDLSELADTECDIEFDMEPVAGTLVHVRFWNQPSEQVAPPLEFSALPMTTKRDFSPRARLELHTGDVLTATVESDPSRTIVEPPGASLWQGSPPNVPPFDWGFMVSGVSPRIGHNIWAHRFDEALEVYEQIFHSEVPLVLRRNGEGRLTEGSGINWLPRSVLSNILLIEGFKDGTLRWQDGELAFLPKLCAQMGFARAEYLAEARGRRPISRGTEVTYERVRARFFWSDESYISDGELSYGQKRLLTFLHYLACNEKFVIADELVNGLHHDWIDFALNEIGDRQAFLTSQNPLLFDYLEFKSPEDVQQQFVLCAAEVGKSRPKMTWQQMSTEKAREFHGAYARGIQYVSEILQTEGLW